MMGEQLLEALQLSKIYGQKQRRPLPFRTRGHVRALHDVSLSVERGSTLAIVGPSGAGKSTLGRCLCGLEHPDEGRIFFQGQDLSQLPGRELARSRRQVQMIFQQSATALNPRFTALDAVAEPLRILGESNRAEKALALMHKVGLHPALAGRRCPLLSGGQRQRVALARALILEPKALVLDEALSGLDRITKEQIVKLLRELQLRLSLAYVFITHDLRLASKLGNTLLVMHNGSVVERGPASEFFTGFIHPLSRSLMEAVPEQTLATVL